MVRNYDYSLFMAMNENPMASTGAGLNPSVPFNYPDQLLYFEHKDNNFVTFYRLLYE